jgi:hypothetical protein
MNDDRARRLAAIVTGAEVRRQLGQAATHTLLDDGRHEVRLHHRAGIGWTVAEAIGNMRPEAGGERQ